MSPGISEAILELAYHARVSALSAMTVYADWPVEARRLDPRPGVDIGLHFVLTDAPALTTGRTLAPTGVHGSVGARLQAAFRGQLDLNEVAAELAAQWDAFEEATGRPPDFVDGHQHMHLLPGVRDVVLRALVERGGERGVLPWLRSCVAPWNALIARGISVPKACFIDRLGRPLHRRAAEMGVPTNDEFRGVSAFRADGAAAEFAAFAAGPGTAPLLMCHPGRGREAGDPIAPRREAEFDIIRSEAFQERLAASKNTLVRRPSSALCAGAVSGSDRKDRAPLA